MRGSPMDGRLLMFIYEHSLPDQVQSMGRQCNLAQREQSSLDSDLLWHFYTNTAPTTKFLFGGVSDGFAIVKRQLAEWK